MNFQNYVKEEVFTGDVYINGYRISFFKDNDGTFSWNQEDSHSSGRGFKTGDAVYLDASNKIGALRKKGDGYTSKPLSMENI